MKSDNNKRSAYFVGTFHGKEKRADIYATIAKTVRENDYVVFDDVNNISYEEAKNRSEKEVAQYWKQEALKKINKSDIFIAEISERSTSIGIEIGLAVGDYKPTLLLQHEEKGTALSVPIQALKSRVKVIIYNESNLEIKIRKWLKKVEDGFVTKYMNIGFTKKQVDFVEFVQKSERIKSFALVIRAILDNQIDVNVKYNEFLKDSLPISPQ